MESIVKIEKMSVVYNQGEPTEFRALNNINLEIYQGEYVVFFGPSGSGKSTLLYTIAGLEIPTTGKVIFNQPKKGYRDLSNLSEEELVQFHQEFVGMIFQAFYLIPSLSAEENISLPAVIYGADKIQRDKSVQSLMQRFGVTKFAERVPAKLSGGQQQRVAIARSLVNNPSIVLADEPVGNLDSENAVIVVDMISDLNKTDNKTVIHVTHDPRHLQLADRVFHISDGEIQRVTVNHNVRRPSQYKGMNRRSVVSDKIATLNPYSNPIEMKAKLVMDHVVSPYTFLETQRIESIIGKFLGKEISAKRMQELFDTSEEKGGVNLYKQTAKKLADQVQRVADEIVILEKEEKKHIPLREQALQLLEFIRENDDIELSALQELRAVAAIAYRLSGNIDMKELQSVLDESTDKGGAGFHKRVAQRVVDEVETIIAEVKL